MIAVFLVAGVIASSSASGEVITPDFYDTHDGTSRAKPQLARLERLRKQKEDIEEAIARAMRGDEPEAAQELAQEVLEEISANVSTKTLPVELTRLLKPDAKAEIPDFEPIQLPSLSEVLAVHKAIKAEMQRIDDDEMMMVFCLCLN